MGAAHSISISSEGKRFRLRGIRFFAQEYSWFSQIMDMSLAVSFAEEGGQVEAGSFSIVDLPSLNNLVIRYIELSTNKFDQAVAWFFLLFTGQGEAATSFNYRRIT